MKDLSHKQKRQILKSLSEGTLKADDLNHLETGKKIFVFRQADRRPGSWECDGKTYSTEEKNKEMEAIKETYKASISLGLLELVFISVYYEGRQKTIITDQN